jgi:hypothetical protein
MCSTSWEKRSGLLPAEAVFPHPGAKGAGIETEKSRCPVFPLDAPTGFLEHMEDVIVFQVGEDLDILP